ncbi:MAG: hypothetical protein QM718_09320 [Steroidobacteraceae bacterium]
MIHRGRILRDISQGDGLVFVNNNQYSFGADRWKGASAPQADMLVDVDIDANGHLVAVQFADPAAVAREQAAKLANAAGATAQRVATEFNQRGLPFIKAYAALIGTPVLVGMGLLLLGWFFFATFSISFMGQGLSVTYYNLMALLNNPQDAQRALMSGAGGGAGLYGFITWLAWLAPLLPAFLKHPKIRYAYCAPLAWMVLAALAGYLKVHSAYAQASEMAGNMGGDYQRMARGMAGQAMDAFLQMVSVGLGFYLAVAGALWLAWLGLRRPAAVQS